MKSYKNYVLIFSLLLFSACTLNNRQIQYDAGVVTPIKQIDSELNQDAGDGKMNKGIILEKENQISKTEIDSEDEQIKLLKQNSRKETEQFTYDDNGKNFPYTIEKFRVLAEIKTADLLINANECGLKTDAKYFDWLLSDYSSQDEGSRYIFYVSEKYRDTANWTITVIPNKIKNTKYSLADFKNDFGQCFAGGSMYPVALSNNYLLFVSAGCGGANNNPELPTGCDISNLVEPTLNLK